MTTRRLPTRASTVSKTGDSTDQQAALRQLKRTMANIDAAREAIAMTKRRMNADEATVEALMRKYKIDRFAEGAIVAEISEEVGNASTVWDIEALQKRLGKQFVEVVTPVKKLVATLLTEREIAAVSTNVPGESKGAIFKIKPLK